MRVVAPLKITNAILTASNVPENDAAAWAAGTTYAKDAEVMKNHRLFRSVAGGNTGNDPETDDGTKWIDLGANNRWRAFDGKVSNRTTQANSITYEITAPETISGIGLLNLTYKNVEIEVRDVSNNLIDHREADRSDYGMIIDWWTAFTIDLTDFDVPDVIFGDLKCFKGNILTVEISTDAPGSDVGVGVITMGVALKLGDTLTDTSIGIRDFSTKERDPFGNAIIVERAFADRVGFQFRLQTNTAAAVRRRLAALRATPALYYAGTDVLNYGAQVFGFFQDFDIPLNSAGWSVAQLRVEGLT